jgi:Na+-driven multidrug efflux pump
MPTARVLKKAIKIGMPIGCERVIMCGAQICTTMIVAPLGMFAIAANSFGINAESLCYMPGYGIADAATTLVGQSVGAKRRNLARSFANITVVMGILIMTLMGVVMYMGAPVMMNIMTPVPEIVSLGVDALRIEAFAEPMFAASIVCYGVFVGAGKTIIPSVMNLGSIWIFRITLAILLAPSMGLNGVWLAMCIELNLRGILFLLRLKSNKWLPKES